MAGCLGARYILLLNTHPSTPSMHSNSRHPTLSSHSRGHVFKSLPRLACRAATRAVAPAVVLAMSTAGEAAAAASSKTVKYPPRVQAVLDYLEQHPMTVSSQAMQYDADPSTPLPDCISIVNLTPENVMLAASSEPPHMARVIAGLLFAACGGLDVAHNLVTPLCWSSWTPYAGQPVAGSPAAAEAAYVHAIVHRQEGSCIGEFGSGFSNASYWYRAAGDHPIAGDLLKAAQKLAAGKPECEAHIAKHGSSWQPSRFVSLCDQVAAAGSSSSGGSSSEQTTVLRSFCEGVMAAELRLLLNWCYRQMP